MICAEKGGQKYTVILVGLVTISWVIFAINVFPCLRTCRLGSLPYGMKHWSLGAEASWEIAMACNAPVGLDGDGDISRVINCENSVKPGREPMEILAILHHCIVRIGILHTAVRALVHAMEV